MLWNLFLMVQVERASRVFRFIIFTFISVLVLSACNPELYKKPAEDFQAASITLREAYFLEWEISNRARIERGDLDDQIAIWFSPVGISDVEIKKLSAKMAERRQLDVHGELRPLREQAFAALEGYASTLVSLSSGEPTERIQSELNGLVVDINNTLEAANKLSIAGDVLSNLQDYAGPLTQYVGILNEIIGLVSDVVREKAIIESIGKSNESILELLNVLKEEAVAAQKNALKETSAAKNTISKLTSHARFQQASNNTKALILKRTAELEVITQQITKLDIASDFESAVKAQGALVEKALLKTPGDWTVKIKQFKDRVTETKMAIEKIKIEM